MWAAGIGKVVGSNSSNFKVGDKVHGRLGMQEYALLDTTKGMVGPYDETLGIEHLAALGAPGNAAHLGLFHTAKFQKGETLLVSGAGGATGLSVIQLAKGAGASRIIGIASGSKRESVLKAGADECLDYNTPDFAKELLRVTEEKINVYFDNTGGPITDAAIRCMARRGRIAVCGAISVSIRCSPSLLHLIICLLCHRNTKRSEAMIPHIMAYRTGASYLLKSSL